MTSTGIGETLGPIASSLLNKYFGFNLAQDYYAMFMISYAIMYIIFAGGRKILRSTETEKAKRQLSIQKVHIELVDEVEVKRV